MRRGGFGGGGAQGPFLTGDKQISCQPSLYLGKGAEHARSEGCHRPVPVRLGQLHSSSQSPALEKGLAEVGDQAPDCEIAVEEIDQIGASAAPRTCEAQARVEGTAGLVDAGGGRRELALCSHQVRSAR